MSRYPGQDFNFLDTVDWCVFHNLCIVRVFDDKTKTYSFMVGLYDGVNHKLKEKNRKLR